jgi:diguanylate cyclase (GGDEF)-like protein
MNARPDTLGTTRSISIGQSAVRAIEVLMRSVAGEAPVPLRSNAFIRLAVVLALLANVFALLLLGGPAIELLWLPSFVGAAVLSGRTGAFVGIGAVLGFAVLAATTNAPTGPFRVALDAALIVVAAIGLRTIVVAAVVNRTAHLRREAELAKRFDAVLDIAGRLATTHEREQLLGAIVEEALRVLTVDATVLRIVRDGRLEVAAWAGMDDADAAQLPVFGPGEAWYGEIAQSGRPWIVEDVRRDPVGNVYDRYAGLFEFGADLIVPLMRDREMIGSLAATANVARTWSAADIAFMSALATHAAIALTNADLLARTELRAAQLGVLQAASARLSRANGVEAIGRAVVEETRRIIDYHNARVYVLEAGDVVPIAFEGTVGAYEAVDFELLRCRLGQGFTGWVAQNGTPLLVHDANADPRGESITGTDDVDESMLVVPMSYDGAVIGVITLSKLGLGQFDEDDLRLLLILADQAATALESARLLARSQGLAGELRRLLDMSSQLSASLDSRQVANLIARHLALAMGVDECAISYWDRATQRVISLGYFPEAGIEELEPYFEVVGFPETIRVLEAQATVVIDTEDPLADPAEVGLLVPAGNQTLIMIPLVAKGQAIGLVELISKSAVQVNPERLELARTMANEAAMALENARLYEVARALADRDPLTGFYNHRYLHERFGEEVVRAQRTRQPLSVLMMDMDDFKLVNDTFGHLFGDQVLAWTAGIIRSTLRASDVAARYGGDEFAILLPASDAEAATSTADRIRDAFAQAAFDSGSRSPVAVSLAIGAATFPVDGRSATELIAAADAALYREKRTQGGSLSRATAVPPAPERIAPDEAMTA